MVINNRLEISNWVHNNVPKESNDWLDICSLVFSYIKNMDGRPKYGEDWSNFFETIDLTNLVSLAQNKLKEIDSEELVVKS